MSSSEIARPAAALIPLIEFPDRETPPMSHHDATATAAAKRDIVGTSLRYPISVKSFSAAHKRRRAQPSVTRTTAGLSA
jgi:hypothetical protein